MKAASTVLILLALLVIPAVVFVGIRLPVLETAPPPQQVIVYHPVVFFLLLANRLIA
jgi:hypothetical protein